MNDELETRLHDAFRSGSLPGAPARLLDHLDQVPDSPLVRGSRRDGGARTTRRPWGALAVAAVLLVGGAIAVSVGTRGPSPLPIASPSAVVAEPTVGGPIRLTYEPQWTSEIPFDAGALAATVEVIQQRIDATGLVGGQATVDDQRRIVVDLPAGIDPDPIRKLIGPTGHLTLVPLENNVLERGARVDSASFPALMDSSEVAGAIAIDDMAGQPALQLNLSGTGGTRFGEYTATHVGSYFAIALDGTVVAAPMINEAIRDGIVQISFPTGAIDATELARLAATIRIGPLPVPIAEVATGPAPTGPLPSASSVAADPPIRCGARVDVGGLQLDCEPAVHAALAFLPAGHPPIREITFDHGCPEIPGRLIDCATQMFGIVGITFVDGSPAVRILVDSDLKASYLPGSSAEPLRLNLNASDLGCDTIRVAYRSLVIHIDPLADDPVRAMADTGHPLNTFWSSTFRGGTSADPVVYDGKGLVVARDGTRIDLPEAAFPSLAGYFVCPSIDAIYVFDRAG